MAGATSGSTTHCCRCWWCPWSAPGRRTGRPGAALAVFALSNAAGLLLLGGSRSDRFGRRPLILLSLAVSAVATIATGFATDFPTLLVASAVAGVGAGVLNPTQQASVADVIGRERRAGPGGRADVLGPRRHHRPADRWGVGGSRSFGLAFAVSGATALVAIRAMVAGPGDPPGLVWTGSAAGRRANARSEHGQPVWPGTAPIRPADQAVR